MTSVRKYWPLALLVAVVALVLFGRGLALDHWLRGFEDAEKAADVRHFKEKAARLGKSLASLERRVHVGDSLAALRPKVTVSLPPSRSKNGTPPKPAANVTSVSPVTPETSTVVVTLPADTAKNITAVVTINDTAYVVPVRVAEVVQGHLTELANADAMRAAADTVIKDARATVAAADTAIAEKKRGFLRRVLSGSITVVCYTGGAAIGGAGGAAIGALLGNVAGAAAGGAAGAVAGLGLCRAIR